MLFNKTLQLYAIAFFSMMIVLAIACITTTKLDKPVVEEVFEEFPAWNRPDLTVTEVTVSPKLANQGETVEIQAIIANRGTGVQDAASVSFFWDEREIERFPVEPLGPGVESTYSMSWSARAPGSHNIRVELQLRAESFDPNNENNIGYATIRVSGKPNPEPSVEFAPIDFAGLDLNPGTSVRIPLLMYNTGFVDFVNIPVRFAIDGEWVYSRTIEYLPPGEDLELLLPWRNIEPGQHLITIKIDWEEIFPDSKISSERSWCAIVPDKPILYDKPAKDKWASIGPKVLNGFPAKPHTHLGVGSNVGRIDKLAFHPKDPKIIYAAAPTGGVWKTTDGGQSWKPLSDKWPTLKIGALAVDPKNPQVVYAATGSSSYKGGLGIFKSIDGGKSWYVFAKKNITEGVSKMEIRYLNGNQFVLYAMADKGLLRYKSNDPFVKNSAPGDWKTIRKLSSKEQLMDMGVSPKDHSLVYLSISNVVYSAKLKRKIGTHQGLYRNRKGVSTNGALSDWEELKKGLPQPKASLDALKKPGLMKFDFFQGNPKMMYAALLGPDGRDGKIGEDIPIIGIYKTLDEGDTWSLVEKVTVKNSYNDFIRIHPTNSKLLYFGGVHLYRRDLSVKGPAKEVLGIHDDMKSLTFDPFDSNYYYITNDGGIWRCHSGKDPKPVALNNDLRVTMFYDFDVSPTNSDLMIGGTQDNGTILYQGKSDWKVIRGGDGLFSLIASDNVFYSQTQTLLSTARCDNGINCNLFSGWSSTNKGLPDKYGDNSFIADSNNPNDPYTLASQGKQVYFTGNGGQSWKPRGPQGWPLEPVGAKVKGEVTRVLLGLDFVIAGTSQGQIWWTAMSEAYGKWHLLYTHSHPVRVNSLSLKPFEPLKPVVLFASFTSYKSGWRGACRLIRDPFDKLGWKGEDITADFPTSNCSPQVISADGFNDDVAYIGTKAGVFRGFNNGNKWFWKPYNDGLPLADVRDLLLAPNKELRAATYGRGAWTVITGN